MLIEKIKNSFQSPVEAGTAGIFFKRKPYLYVTQLGVENSIELDKGQEKRGKRISNIPSTTLRINSPIMVGQAATLQSGSLPTGSLSTTYRDSDWRE